VSEGFASPRTAELVLLPEATETQKWSSSAVAWDIATVGAGGLLATFFNTLLVFLIPRLVSIEDYGYWRLFLLYAGYVGLLHLGLADGALLRWAGKSLDEFRHEVLASTRFLFCQQIVVIVPCCVIFAFVLPPKLRFIGIGVATFALVYNLSALLQFSLQSAKIFRPVAVATAAPFGLLLVFVLLKEVSGPPNYQELVAFYFLSWLLVFFLLLFQAKPWQCSSRIAAISLGPAFIRAGLPILLANAGVVLLLGMDRLAVSWIMSIQNFAQYSLAASTMAVPIAAIQAVYRVFFSHVASLDADQRKSIYRSASRFLLLSWSLSLPYYFALDAFVRHYLPGYTASLAVARTLLLGILFVGSIQVLHMSFSYLHGRQGLFLIRTLLMLAVGVSLTLFAVMALRSLFAVATAQVTTLGLWWLLNEWTLRDLTGQTATDWLKFLGLFAGASLCYWVACRYGHGAPSSIVLYYACIAVLLLTTRRTELRLAAFSIR
jgi:O-antigen/teichoic acid export membrane protein